MKTTAKEAVTMEFTCKTCGAKFTREWNGHVPVPSRCEKCKRETALECGRKWHAAKRAERKKARAENKVVKRCRRCGREFEERSLAPYKICNSDEGYVEHRYCPSCRWTQKRAAHLCDPRYVAVGGHGGFAEDGR